MHINHTGSSRNNEDDCGRLARFYSDEAELLCKSAARGLHRRGYGCVAVGNPVKRGDVSLIYMKAYAKSGRGLPDVAVECFREASKRVSRRAEEIRPGLPSHNIVLVFPERVAVKVAEHADAGDEVWLADSDGNATCYAKGDVKGLRTHLRNKILRRTQKTKNAKVLMSWQMAETNTLLFPEDCWKRSER